MSHSPGDGDDTHAGSKEAVGEVDVGTLLGTLEDPDCRAIVEATSTQPLSAKELSQRCDLPLSTTYRKLEQLTDVGALEQRVRLSQSEQYPREYTLRIRHVELVVDPDAGIQLSVSRDETPRAEQSLIAGAD